MSYHEKTPPSQQLTNDQVQIARELAVLVDAIQDEIRELTDSQAALIAATLMAGRMR